MFHLKPYPAEEYLYAVSAFTAIMYSSPKLALYTSVGVNGIRKSVVVSVGMVNTRLPVALLTYPVPAIPADCEVYDQ